MRVLVIEDEINLNKGIVQMLSGIAECDSAYDGVLGLAMAEKSIYDLILLDLMLPKMNGLEMLTCLRRTNFCPVIILTALDDVDNKIRGLKLGADDYMVKPFDKEELIARCEAVMRRYSSINITNSYTYDGLTIDFATKKVTYNGDNLNINGKIYEILEYLIRNKDIVMPKEQIFNRIWGFESDTVLTVVDVYMSKIRKMLEGCGNTAASLVNIKKVGYSWTESQQ